MGCICVRQTELPNTSPLFADLVYNPDRLNAFYSYTRRETAAYRHAAGRIALPADRRAALVEALRPLNPRSAALERLAEPGTVAVVTGQQVGLFSGPAYTVYKALTAIRLAGELTAQGIPAVPVFWLATEDHDFAEVNHCWVFDASHNPRKLQMKRAPASSQPVGDVELASPPLEELRAVLAGFPFEHDVAAMVEAAYRLGRTMGQAFGALLREALSGFDLVQVDPMLPAMRELAAPAIRQVLAAAPEIAGEVLQRNRELAEAGYHAQVHVEDQTSFVFLLENGRRLTLRRHGRDYVQNGRRFTTEELGSRAAQLSPNALLRPVVQDSMLPTVAYVGGPAELAYLAQSEVIYRRVLGRMPVPVPRAGFTILDARSRKLLERYGLCLADFYHGQDVLRERMAAKLVPAPLAAAVAETKTAMGTALDRLRGALDAFDPTLSTALSTSRRKIEHQIAKSERKIGREMMARDERASRDAAYLYGLIYPERHLQERLYSILPFLAAHGPGLVQQLFDAVRLDCPDHQVLTV
jgi:bacillithiol biosynthesis cysteine-adding enzyme BshC